MPSTSNVYRLVVSVQGKPECLVAFVEERPIQYKAVPEHSASRSSYLIHYTKELDLRRANGSQLSYGYGGTRLFQN
jgi:hypothetical protein